jgi:hypothetical protein
MPHSHFPFSLVTYHYTRDARIRYVPTLVFKKLRLVLFRPGLAWSAAFICDQHVAGGIARANC